jgi:hypothetical protein
MNELIESVWAHTGSWPKIAAGVHTARSNGPSVVACDQAGLVQRVVT